MLLSKHLSQALAILLCASMVGQSALAGGSGSVIPNVSLTKAGQLQGALVTPQGQPMPSTPVTVKQNGKVISTVSTDSDGIFRVANLQTGVYQMQGPAGTNSVRVWDAKVAPPNAKSGVLLVNGDGLVRGAPVIGVLGPLGVIGLTAAAVGLTVWAVDEASDDDDPASPQ